MSLRRTGTIYRLLTDHADRVAYYKERVTESRYYEDVFFAVEAPKLEPNFSIPPVEEAAHFSFDTYPWLCYQLNGGKIPICTLPGWVCITVWYAGYCVFSGWEPEGGF